MKSTRLIMGMPVTVEIANLRRDHPAEKDVEDVFDYFQFIDDKFSTYKENSEIGQLNRNELTEEEYSDELREVLMLSEETKRHTHGYFDIQTPSNTLDPSGLVKGWAINKAALILKRKGYEDFYVDVGGDVQACGKNHEGKPWVIGIRNPFQEEQLIKIIHISGRGVATSGTYIRGQHIYNPHQPFQNLLDIVSLTVIGPNVYEADRFATAAFAMGSPGISFIESQPGLEGYMVGRDGIATMTSGFSKYAI